MSRVAKIVAGGVVALLVLSIFLFSLIRRLRQWHRLSHIPGPRWAGFSRLAWLVPLSTSGKYTTWMRDIDKKYGRLVRVGPKTLVTSDWRYWKRIMSAESAYIRSDRYAGFRVDPRRDHVFSTTDERQHTRLKSIMIHGYTGKEVEGFEEKLDTEVLSLIHLLESSYIAYNKPFDFARKAQYFAIDAITHIALGKPIGFLETDSDVYNYIGFFEKQMAVVGFLTNFPGFTRMFAWPVLNRAIPKPTDKDGLGKLMGVAKEAVTERFATGTNVHQKDMLGSFIARGLTPTELEDELIVQVAGGTDTSATVIRSATLNIATNPRIHRKLLEEIDSVPPYPKDKIIDDATARGLPYLTAIIRESLRWLSPAIDMSPKVVPPEGDVWNGVHIPGGTHVGWNAMCIMRDPEVWGEDSEEFRPERWLEAVSDPDKLRDMETVVELNFAGSSRYECLGRTVALVEIRKVLFELFRRYELVVMNAGNPWTSIEWNLIKQYDFWLKAYPRKNSPSILP